MHARLFTCARVSWWVVERPWAECSGEAADAIAFRSRGVCGLLMQPRPLSDAMVIRVGCRPLTPPILEAPAAPAAMGRPSRRASTSGVKWDRPAREWPDLCKDRAAGATHVFIFD